MSQQPRHSGDSNGQPDTLRDARLAQALKHMPDAHMQPDPQARNAVMQAALKALESASATHKQANPGKDAQLPTDGSRGLRKVWHWLLGQPGQRIPLTGVLASLLIASFVTVMWFGQEVPDANPESVPVAVVKYGDTTGPTEKAEGASASNMTAQKATEPPGASAAPGGRALPSPVPAPAPQPAPAPIALPDAPRAQSPALTPPGAVSHIQSAANLPVPPQPPAPAKESAAERSDARPQPAPMAPMAEAAKPAAKMAAPVPAPAAPAVTAAAAPAPAPAVIATPPPMVESAARARRDAAVSRDLQVVLDGRRRTLTAAQSASLLASLRTLPWQVESSRNGVGIGQSGLLADSAAAFTVQTPDGERWEISASSVRATSAGIVSTSPLTAAQWLQLRALAAPSAP